GGSNEGPDVRAAARAGAGFHGVGRRAGGPDVQRPRRPGLDGGGGGAQTARLGDRQEGPDDRHDRHRLAAYGWPELRRLRHGPAPPPHALCEGRERQPHHGHRRARAVQARAHPVVRQGRAGRHGLRQARRRALDLVGHREGPLMTSTLLWVGIASLVGGVGHVILAKGMRVVGTATVGSALVRTLSNPWVPLGVALAAAALAAALAAPFLFTGLGRAPFDDPGEGMHAEIARELAASGDPLRLTLDGVRYVDKPPLLYLLLASAFAVGGASEGTARAVAALGALVAVAATAWLGSRLHGGPWGLLAGVALLTSCGFFAYGRYVRPETLFVAGLIGGFALLLPAVLAGHRGLAALGLGVFGLAALAKDPLGALLPPVAVGLALAAAGRARPLGAWLPWPG